MSATTPDVIENYLGGLSTRLVGPRRAKSDLLGEARDGLLDATDAYLDAGLGPAEAADRAVADFGAYRQVVPSFQAELAAAQGRRTALFVAITMPTVMVLSRLMWAGGPGTDAGAPSHYLVLAHTFDVLQVTAAIMAGLTLVGYGVGQPLPAGRPGARGGAADPAHGCRGAGLRGGRGADRLRHLRVERAPLAGSVVLAADGDRHDRAAAVPVRGGAVGAAVPTGERPGAAGRFAVTGRRRSSW